MKNIAPKRTDRAVIIGMTGSGKTTLARRLLAHCPYVVVYDAKGMLTWGGYQRVTTLDELIAAGEKYARLIYAPNHHELTDLAIIDRFFMWIYQRRNTTVYVDEVYSVTNKAVIPHYYHALLTRGREMGISVISSTQRPKDIPQSVLSESECYYVFRLMLPQDRKKIRDIVALDSDKLEAIKRHEFYYANAEGDIIGPLRLKI